MNSWIWWGRLRSGAAGGAAERFQPHLPAHRPGGAPSGGISRLPGGQRDAAPARSWPDTPAWYMAPCRCGHCRRAGALAGPARATACWRCGSWHSMTGDCPAAGPCLRRRSGGGATAQGAAGSPGPGEPLLSHLPEPGTPGPRPSQPDGLRGRTSSLRLITGAGQGEPEPVRDRAGPTGVPPACGSALR